MEPGGSTDGLFLQSEYWDPRTSSLQSLGISHSRQIFRTRISLRATWAGGIVEEAGVELAMAEKQ